MPYRIRDCALVLSRGKKWRESEDLRKRLNDVTLLIKGITRIDNRRVKACGKRIAWFTCSQNNIETFIYDKDIVILNIYRFAMCRKKVKSGKKLPKLKKVTKKH